MGAISLFSWLFVIGAGFAIGLPVARILRRLGYSGWWALLWFVSLANLIALWVLAYNRWPREARAEEAFG